MKIEIDATQIEMPRPLFVKPSIKVNYIDGIVSDKKELDEITQRAQALGLFVYRTIMEDEDIYILKTRLRVGNNYLITDKKILDMGLTNMDFVFENFDMEYVADLMKV